MALNVLYFAGLREALGCASESLELESGIHSVATLRAHLVARGGDWQRLASMKNLRVAVNQEMVPFETSLKDGDEIAFFPPVTGG